MVELPADAKTDNRIGWPRQQKATPVLRTQHKKSISVPRGKGSITNGYPKTKFTGQSEILPSSIVRATVGRDPGELILIKILTLHQLLPVFLRIPSAGSRVVPFVLPETPGVEK